MTQLKNDRWRRCQDFHCKIEKVLKYTLFIYVVIFCIVSDSTFAEAFKRVVSKWKLIRQILIYIFLDYVSATSNDGIHVRSVRFYLSIFWPLSDWAIVLIVTIVLIILFSRNLDTKNGIQCSVLEFGLFLLFTIC